MTKVRCTRSTLKKNILIVIGILLVLWVLQFIKQFHQFGPELSYSKVFFDRNNTLLRLTISKDEKYRIETEFKNLPSLLTEAVLLKEDRFFFSHPGVNPIALFRAFV